MNVTLDHGAQIQLRTLGAKDQDEIDKWCRELRNFRLDSPKWTSRTVQLLLGRRQKKVYLLKLDSDLRIFFERDTTGITVTDIVRQGTLDIVRQSIAS